MTPIAKAIEILGSQAELARRLGVSPPFVSQLLSGERPIPLQHAISIEKETAGAVTVETLRPDIDWAVIRGAKAVA
jgi:DNA-binding transcriptional regulator YdaS (Cro superfamily)